MKRRTRNKIIKRFCEDYSLDIAWFKDWTEGKTAKQIKASLFRRLDDLMEYHYHRYYGF